MSWLDGHLEVQAAMGWISKQVAEPAAEPEPQQAQHEARRDELAAWLVQAEALLRKLPEGDPRRVKGEQVWQDRRQEYQALCRAVPEPEGTPTCLDCGRPSERWRTPCDRCSLEVA